jgi:4-amino-4-deoxy-L-arabinose transferase-like glycosyltransferase
MSTGRFACALALVALLALGLRLFRLDELPPGFYVDEAAIGVDAASLAATGHDLHGVAHPAIFEALEDWKHPIYTYVAVPCVRALGPTKLAVRLPAAILGTLTVIVLALLALELGTTDVVALLAALLLAITPWHIQYSRMAWEAVSLGFTAVLALTLYFRARRKGGAARFALAGAAFGLVLYSYTPAKLLLPAFMAGLVAIEVRDRRWVRMVSDRVQKQAASAPTPLVLLVPVEPPVPRTAVRGKDALAFAVLLALVATPMVVAQVQHFHEIQVRFNALSVLNEEHPFKAAFDSYTAHLQPRFLFWSGDANARQGWAGWGELLLATAPFVVVGLARVFMRRNAEDLILVAWFFIYPLGAALTSEGIPHASRSFLGVPLFCLLAAIGVGAALERLEGTGTKLLGLVLIVGAFLGNGALAYRFYVEEYPTLAAPSWNAGVEELIATCEAKRGVWRHVQLTRELHVDRSLVLFFSRFDPVTFDPARRDPYYVWPLITTELPRYVRTLPEDEVLVAYPSQLPGRRPTLAVRDATGQVVIGIYSSASPH